VKFAVSGKGGVGKTTFSALLARSLSNMGYEVVAVDADPDSNLCAALGVSADLVSNTKPLIAMDDLIEERTGAKPGERGSFFKLNPYVSDIPDRFSLKIDNVKVLTLGSCKKGGTGCYCAENVMVKRLVDYLLLKDGEALIIDMEAGIEHLSRGTAASVGALISVVEPGMRSIETAQRVNALARDLGISRHFVVANKVKGDKDREFILSTLQDYELLGFLPFDTRLMDADREGRSPYLQSPEVMEQMEAIIKKLMSKLEIEN
jgi:CO dehydrogenase maturation factor